MEQNLLFFIDYLNKIDDQDVLFALIIVMKKDINFMSFMIAAGIRLFDILTKEKRQKYTQFFEQEEINTKEMLLGIIKEYQKRNDQDKVLELTQIINSVQLKPEE